eukprot:gene5402-15549_t
MVTGNRLKHAKEERDLQREIEKAKKKETAAVRAARKHSAARKLRETYLDDPPGDAYMESGPASRGSRGVSPEKKSKAPLSRKKAD